MDPKSQAELPDETPDPRLLPGWMRQPAPRPARPARAELPPSLEPAADPPEPGELDAALPAWLLTPPRPALPLPPRKTPARADLAEADSPGPEFVDAPSPDEEGEVDLARLPAWMRGAPEHGPPVDEQAQAARGAAQDDIGEDLPG